MCYLSPFPVMIHPVSIQHYYRLLLGGCYVYTAKINKP